MSGTMPTVQWIPGKILPHFDPSHLSVGQITRKLGFSASHWLSQPIRGLGKIQHAQWIPGKIQAMDPTCPVDDSGPQGVSFF